MAFLPVFGAALAGAGASIAGASAAIAPFAVVSGVGLGAYSLLNQPKAPKLSAPGQPAALPPAPAPQDSLAKAQQDATDRIRMIASTGGQTVYAGMGNTSIDSTQLQRKTLLGQ